MGPAAGPRGRAAWWACRSIRGGSPGRGGQRADAEVAPGGEAAEALANGAMRRVAVAKRQQ